MKCHTDFTDNHRLLWAGWLWRIDGHRSLGILPLTPVGSDKHSCHRCLMLSLLLEDQRQRETTNDNRDNRREILKKIFLRLWAKRPSKSRMLYRSENKNPKKPKNKMKKIRLLLLALPLLFIWPERAYSSSAMTASDEIPLNPKPISTPSAAARTASMSPPMRESMRSPSRYRTALYIMVNIV